MRCSSAGNGNFSWNRVLDDACVRPNELSQDIPSCPKMPKMDKGIMENIAFLHVLLHINLQKITIIKSTADATRAKNANGFFKTKQNASLHKNAVQSINLL